MAVSGCDYCYTFLCDARSCHSLHRLDDESRCLYHNRSNGHFRPINRYTKQELLSELINEWCTTKGAFVIRPWNSFTSLEASSEFVRPLFLHTHS
jgi:hypothetical protein